MPREKVRFAGNIESVLHIVYKTAPCGDDACCHPVPLWYKILTAQGIVWARAEDVKEITSYPSGM